MEKKNKLKSDRFIIVFLTLSYVGALIFEYLLKISGSILSVSTFAYWLFLIFWIYIILKFKAKSVVSFVLSFILYFFSSLLVILGLMVTGEIIMKYSFIFLFLAVFQSLMEFLSSKRLNQ